MRNIKNSCLKLLSKAVAAASVFLVRMSTGTISLFGIYEAEMPAVLRPLDDEMGE